MGELKEQQINVFVNDEDGSPIGGATVRMFDNDDEEKEEIGKAIMPATRNVPARFTLLPDQYKSVILLAEVVGMEPQRAIVGADVGNYTFTFAKHTASKAPPTKEKTSVETRLLTSLGKIAGLAGVALGIFLLLFEGVLKKDFLPKAGLTSGQAYHVILALMILTFGIAAIGVLAWLMGQGKAPDTPVPPVALVVFAFLTVAVLGTAATVGAEGGTNRSTEQPPSEVGKPPVVAKSQTGDYVIDSVRDELTKMRTERADVSEAKILEVLTPLFTRAEFSCSAGQPDWGTMLWAEAATRLTLEDSLKYFKSHPAVYDDLGKSTQLLNEMQNDASKAYGPAFSITDHIGKYENQNAFVANLPPMMTTGAGKSYQVMLAARRAYLKKLKMQLRKDLHIPPDASC
jgi:hypothetical protein